ncbi:hypothetical protein PMW_23 [Pseudomonas phage phiPMW]|uniref:Uncharacterized protein n=1 Tax=Pseudomonas phage phiPMW TaxID=1815582 RepID=A0A1S5R193_9CAUD|nr:hypothetical protein FDG97_gp023 [Pseudomonas phage phiPMW]ANA49148.1 hypothetical protein PMW_23 [Pseudomonas phage phiPMW]
MKHSTFMETYSGEVRCMVTYTDNFGRTMKGIALQEPTKSIVTGKYCVDVDSFVNRVPLSRIHKIERTDKRWSN